MWIVLIIAVCFGLGALFGAPYLPVLGRDVDQLLALTNLQAGQTLIDLGCGDGRLLKAAAKRGIKGVGYEINPVVAVAAVINCWPYRKLVTIRWANYWHTSLPQASAIYVFLIDRYMAKLDSKLSAEITRPTTVVSYIFKIPGHEPVATTKNSYAYIYPKSSN